MQTPLQSANFRLHFAMIIRDKNISTLFCNHKSNGRRFAF